MCTHEQCSCFTVLYCMSNGQDSRVFGAVNSVVIHYSVNGGTEKVIDTPYQGSNIITNVVLSDVQYGSDISMQLSVHSNSTISGRSELLMMRTFLKVFVVCM